jgi:catechol 2,3-dioxygenase-like lactoylglutathione lyase family enzyme
MSTANPTRTAITHISIVTVHVADQDEAIRFYTEALGFELRSDAPMPGTTERWVTVAPAGSKTELVLASGYADGSGAPRGADTGMVLETDDMEATYRALSSRGVQFTEAPSRQFFGHWARFVDQDGNGFGLHQALEQ